MVDVDDASVVVVVVVIAEFTATEADDGDGGGGGEDIDDLGDIDDDDDVEVRRRASSTARVMEREYEEIIELPIAARCRRYCDDDVIEIRRAMAAIDEGVMVAKEPMWIIEYVIIE